LKFLATHDFTGALKQHSQHLKGLLLKPDSEAVLAQFASAKIHFEDPKTERPAKLMGFLHEEVKPESGRV
jgi:hypothetical protein